MGTSGESTVDPDPGEVVRSFIAAMSAWETETAVAHRRARDAGLGATFDNNQSVLEEIFRSHCTPRDRPWGRLKAPFFQRPPQYDPAAEKVVEVTLKDKRVATVDTMRTAVLGGGRYRYTLHTHNGQWLIDNISWFSGGEWKREAL
jgi:NTF2 fold immunity protein